nr:MAG TPA: hypothetical protein [Caudoviricetes sp.]
MELCTKIATPDCRICTSFAADGKVINSVGGKWEKSGVTLRWR